MKTSIFVALFAAAALISGCDDKKKDADEGDDESGEKSEKGGDGDIPKECDEYLKTVEKCLKDMPAEAKTAFEQSAKAQRDAIKAATTPEAKKALKDGCKTALDAMKQNPACK